MSRWAHWRHEIAHKLGWNTGVVEAQTICGTLFMGFRCDGCGRWLQADIAYLPVHVTRGFRNRSLHLWLNSRSMRYAMPFIRSSRRKTTPDDAPSDDPEP